MIAKARARLVGLVGRLREEHGVALPMALLIMSIGLSLAAVPIVASVNSQNADSRNQAGNEALAAAEAGTELAVLRQSQALATATTPCVSATLAKSAIKEEVEGSKWCAPVEGNVGETKFAYQVNPCYAENEGGKCNAKCAEPTKEDLIRVVSTGYGKVGGVEPTKRIQVTACAVDYQEPPTTKTITTPNSTADTITEPVTTTKTVTTEKPGEVIPPPNVFAHGQFVGIESLDLNNNAQIYNGGAGSNGAVSLTGSANVCGTVYYGTTKSANNGSENAPSGCAAGRSFVNGTSEYPGVALPANIATKNSNGLLVNGGNVSWSASNRSLTLNYGTLTLNGTEPYFLCQLVVAGGGQLLMASGSKIRIFFDSPKNCPGLNGGAQLQIANGTYVGPDSNHGPGFYFVGSEVAGETSRVELGGGASVSQYVVYAPKSTVVANNNFKANGAIIGKTLEMAGGAHFNESGAFTPPSTEEFLASTTGTPTYSTTTTTTTTTRTTTTTKTITSTETTPGKTTKLAFNRRVFVECTATRTAGPSSGC